MIEDKLRELIIIKYGSVREFANKINIPYTTMVTILKRGIQNANVVNVIKICKKLDIDIEDLVDGKIKERNKNEHKSRISL